MSKAFRARSARAQYEMHHGPNMTPMVDVVMVILIFFMASAAMLGPEWFIRSALPVAGPAGEAAAMPTRVRVLLDGGTDARIAVDEAEAYPLPFERVRADLEGLVRRGGEVVVLVEPSGSAPYDQVVRVHEWAASMGVKAVGIAERGGEE